MKKQSNYMDSYKELARRINNRRHPKKVLRALINMIKNDQEIVRPVEILSKMN